MGNPLPISGRASGRRKKWSWCGPTERRPSARRGWVEAAAGIPEAASWESAGDSMAGACRIVDIVAAASAMVGIVVVVIDIVGIVAVVVAPVVQTVPEG